MPDWYHYTKRVPQHFIEIISQFHYSLWHQISLVKWFMIELQAFLDKNNILYRFQWRSRKFFFTKPCPSYFNNKIATGFESGLYIGMTLTDLQKAFDTINHEILINEMKYLGFSKDIIFWFKSYLSNRKFKTNLNKTFLETGKLLYGVPQGSILGPLLFLFLYKWHVSGS